MKSLPIKTKNNINKELTSMNAYYSEIPINKIKNIIESYGVKMLQEDRTEWHGFFTGSIGSAMIELGLENTRKDNGDFDIFTFSQTCLMISWYCMASGNFEIISYIS